MSNRRLYNMMLGIIKFQLARAEDFHTRHEKCFEILPCLNRLLELMTNVKHLVDKPNYDNIENDMYNLKIAMASVFFWLCMRQQVDDLYFKSLNIETLKIPIKSDLLNNILYKKPYKLNNDKPWYGPRFSIDPLFTNDRKINFAPNTYNIINVYKELIDYHPDFILVINFVIKEVFDMYSKNTQLTIYDDTNKKKFAWVSLTCEINTISFDNPVDDLDPSSDLYVSIKSECTNNNIINKIDKQLCLLKQMNQLDKDIYYEIKILKILTSIMKNI